jgi:ankyrin repeat protein
MNKSILVDDYMMDTTDDERVINFLKTDKCSLDMVNYQDGDGWCALNLAARLNRFDVVQALVEKGANVNLISWDSSFNSLMYSIVDGDSYFESEKENQLKTIKLLIEAGTNLNFEDRFSAFTLACEMNNTSIIRLLLEKNVNIDFKDENDKTGLDYINENNNQEALSMVNSYLMNIKLNEDLKEKTNTINKMKV